MICSVHTQTTPALIYSLPITDEDVEYLIQTDLWVSLVLPKWRTPRDDDPDSDNMMTIDNLIMKHLSQSQQLRIVTYIMTKLDELSCRFGDIKAKITQPE